MHLHYVICAGNKIIEIVFKYDFKNSGDVDAMFDKISNSIKCDCDCKKDFLMPFKRKISGWLTKGKSIRSTNKLQKSDDVVVTNATATKFVKTNFDKMFISNKHNPRKGAESHKENLKITEKIST